MDFLEKRSHTFFSCIWLDDKFTSIFVNFAIMFCSMSVDKISMAGEEGEHAWLEEIDKPDDFVVVGAKYFGPKIVVQWFVVIVGDVGLDENECLVSPSWSFVNTKRKWIIEESNGLKRKSLVFNNFLSVCLFCMFGCNFSINFISYIWKFSLLSSNWERLRIAKENIREKYVKEFILLAESKVLNAFI